MQNNFNQNLKEENIFQDEINIINSIINSIVDKYIFQMVLDVQMFARICARKSKRKIVVDDRGLTGYEGNLNARGA